jgi:hypothetical protein
VHGGSGHGSTQHGGSHGHVVIVDHHGGTTSTGHGDTHGTTTTTHSATDPTHGGTSVNVNVGTQPVANGGGGHVGGTDVGGSLGGSHNINLPATGGHHTAVEHGGGGGATAIRAELEHELAQMGGADPSGGGSAGSQMGGGGGGFGLPLGNTKRPGK